MLVTFECKQLANLFIAEATATPSTFVSGFQQFQLLHNFPNKDVGFPEGGGDLINLLPSSEPGLPQKVPVDRLGLAKLLTNQTRMFSFHFQPHQFPESSKDLSTGCPTSLHKGPQRSP